MIYLPDFYIVICKKYKYIVLLSQINIYFVSQKPCGSKNAITKPYGLNKTIREKI
jgi:hypothetical protein